MGVPNLQYGDAPLNFAKKILHPKRVRYPVAVYAKFQLSISDSSRDMMGVPNLQ